MRPVLQGDLVAAARYLLTQPDAARADGITRLVAQAHAADLYRKRFGRAHPRCGNGSLAARALMAPLPPEPYLSDRSYLEALGLVISCLLARGRQK